MARAPSPWLTEKYTTSSGNQGQRYVLDSNGNKIPKDPSMKPEDIAKLLTEKAAKKNEGLTEKEIKEKRLKKTVAKMNKIHRARHEKRPVPLYLRDRMRDIFDRQKEGTGSIRSAEFNEANSDYHVILHNGEADWLLIHATIRRSLDYIGKWFFYNPYTETAIPFDHDAHRASKVGDKGIQWPEKTTTPAFEPEAPAKVRKPRKAV